MKKRIILILFSLCMLGTIPGYAEADAVVTAENERIIINGATGVSAEDTVNVLVLNPGYTPETAQKDPKGIRKMAEVVTDEEGKFSLAFPVWTEGGAESGYYTVYLRFSHLSVPVEKRVYFASKQEQLASIRALNAAGEENIGEALEKAVRELAVDENLYRGSKGTKLNERVYGELRKKPLPEDEGKLAEAKERLTQILVLQALEQKSEAGVFYSEGRFLYGELFDLPALDETPENLTVWDCWKNRLNEQGVVNVKNSLLGETYGTAEDLQLTFARSVVVEGIRNNRVDGWGHISPLLKANAGYVGLDLRNYLGREAEIDRKLLKSSCGSIGEIQRILDSRENKPGTGGGSGTGGGTGGGGGGSSSVGYPNRNENAQSPGEVKPEIEKTVHDEFTDMMDYQWAGDAVLALLNKGVISRSPEKCFYPGNPITRAEFLKMLVIQLEIPLSQGDGVSAFADVTDEDWCSKYISAAYEKGIVKGIREDYFGKDAYITRQDMATLLYRALKAEGWDKGTAVPVEFSDESEIDEYAKTAVSELSAAGLIKGMGNGTFCPQELCNRAQAAQLIKNCDNR